MELAILPLEILIFDRWISLIFTLFLSDLYLHLASCHPSWFYFLILSLGIGLLHVEAGGVYQSAQRKRGGFVMYREATWCLFVFFLDFWDSFYHSLLYFNFGDEIFNKVGRV